MSRKTTATERLKTVKCEHCDKPMDVGSNARNPQHHFECGLQAAIDAQVQMRRKSGPYYERWRQGMMRAQANWAPTPLPPGQMDDGGT